MARNNKSAMRDLAEMVPPDATRVGIMHVAAVEKMMELNERVGALLPRARVELWEIGPVVGIHVGPGTVGLAWLR